MPLMGREFEIVTLLSRDLRCTFEETAVGLILFALRVIIKEPHLEKRHADYRAFVSEILEEIVDYFDADKYPDPLDTEDVVEAKSVIQAAKDQAKIKEEKLIDYIARLVKQDMAQAEAEEPEPVLAGGGKESQPETAAVE